MIEMPDDDQTRELKFQLWRWILFLMSAVLFIVSSIKNGDVIGFVASALFLVGCVVFMIPLVSKIRANSADRDVQGKGLFRNRGNEESGYDGFDRDERL